MVVVRPPMVITVGAGGDLSALQRKKGKGLDLRQYGAASVKRSTEIKWDEVAQMWFVFILKTPFSSCPPNTKLRVGNLYLVSELDHLERAIEDETAKLSIDGMIMFGDYDDAVRMEVAHLDACRLYRVFQPVT